MLGKLRKYIITGLLIWIPLGITILVIKLLVDLMDKTTLFLPPTWRPEYLVGFDIPGLGIIVSSVIVFLTGFFLTNLAGKRLIKWGENILDRIPLVRSIYSSVKQVTETVLSSEGDTFSAVYLIEYPRKGIWTLCFKTGTTPDSFNDATDEKLVTVFVPTTPNPTSGFIIFTPIKDVKVLDIDVEEALKLVMSLGVVAPSGKTVLKEDIEDVLDNKVDEVVDEAVEDIVKIVNKTKN